MNFVRFIVAVLLILLTIIVIGFAIFGAAYVAILIFQNNFDAKHYSRLFSALSGEIALAVPSITIPAVIVACFRFQYSKWTRFKAAFKSIAIAFALFGVWLAIYYGLLRRFLPISEATSLAIAVSVLCSFGLYSGLMTSRRVPVPNRPPLGPRPLPIRIFEGIFYALLIVGFINFVFRYSDIVRQIHKATNQQGTPPGSILAIIPSIVLSFALMICLVVLIARFGSVMARNTYFFMLAFGFLGFLVMLFNKDMTTYFAPNTTDLILNIAGYVGGAICIGLLLTPSARNWINRKEAVA